MPSLLQILLVAPTLLSVALAQGVVVSAQGTKGTPASLGLQVVQGGKDANVINAAEIAGNVVNECGRTLVGGNIDIGENTETQLSNNTVTSVTKGSKLAMTILQGGADGAGPYTCDMDLTSNADGTSGQTPLDVTETTSGANILLSITMPSNMTCVGASTGNVCTVRCVNSAAAGPFGGCVAVQQTDVTAKVNTPENIATAQTPEGINAQIAENIADLPAAMKAEAEAPLASQGINIANALLTLVATPTSSAAAATSTAATAKASKGGKAGKGANSM